MEIGEKALEKQMATMEEQQKKAGEFVDKKVRTKYILHGLWKQFCEIRHDKAISFFSEFGVVRPTHIFAFSKKQNKTKQNKKICYEEVNDVVKHSFTFNLKK